MTNCKFGENNLDTQWDKSGKAMGIYQLITEEVLSIGMQCEIVRHKIVEALEAVNDFATVQKRSVTKHYVKEVQKWLFHGTDTCN